MMLVAANGVRSQGPIILVNDWDHYPQSSQSYEQSEVEPGHLFDSARLSAPDSLLIDLRQTPTEAASQWT